VKLLFESPISQIYYIILELVDGFEAKFSIFFPFFFFFEIFFFKIKVGDGHQTQAFSEVFAVYLK